jgi:hypothetical protein
MSNHPKKEDLRIEIDSLRSQIAALRTDIPAALNQLADLSIRLYSATVILAHEMARPEPAVEPEREKVIEPQPEPVQEPEPEVLPRQINLLDAIEELSPEEAQPTLTPFSPAPIPTPEPAPAQPAPEPTPTPFHSAPEPATVQAAPVSGPTASAPSVPAPTPNPTASSINDRLATDRAKKSLADKLALTPLADIKKSISLNLKFQFINELFGGDAIAFEDAISRLNTALDGIAAMDILEKDLCPKQGWDEESKIYLDLRTLVERRYL